MSTAKYPATWEIIPLKEIARARMGKTILKKDLTATGVPVYSAGASTEPWGFLEDCDITFGLNTLVISARGNIGSPKRPRLAPFVCTQTTIACSAFLADTVGWLHWFLTQFDYSTKSSQTTIPMLRTSDVDSFVTPLPPLAEQRRIVAKIEELFSELDAGEESLRRARRQLGVYRQSLLKQAFEGKLTEHWRKQNPDLLESSEQLLSRINAKRETHYEWQIRGWEIAVEKWVSTEEKGKKPTKPRPPKDSDPIAKGELRHLPELPSAWIYARLSESIVNIDAGKSFSCDERPPSGDEIGVAKVSAVTWGEYDEAECKTCRDAAKIVPEYYIKPGDFLLSRANTIELVGAVVIVKRTTKNVMLSDKTLRIHFAGIESHYILQYLRCRTGRLEIMARSSGNQESMRNIGQDRVGAIITPLCSLPEQREIVCLLDEQFTVIEQNEREIDAALKRSAALRQSVLKKAFTGQLVPQDPTDQPASTLLERIRKEREVGNKNRKS